MLKQLIKNLAAEQVAMKKARKTGTYVHGYCVEGTKLVWREATPELMASWKAANTVRDNRLKITAALNLYHEQRGSDYRHGVQDSDQYRYQFHFQELTGLLAGK